jgi:hypothetical protein
MVCNAQVITNLIKQCPSPVHDLQDSAIEKDIQSGKTKIRVIGNPENLAILAYEIIGTELLIVALKSIKTNSDIDLSVECTKEAEKIGREKGCKYIRFHTFRPGLVVKALEQGYLPAEFILRKKL